MTFDTENRVAIVGLGGIFPDAGNRREFWQNIVEKRVSIERLADDAIEREVFYRPDVLHRQDKGDRSYTDLRATLKHIDFDPKRFRIPPMTARHMDSNQKLSLMVAEEAISQGGLESVSKDRVSVFMGNTMIGKRHHENILRFDCDKYEYYLSRHQAFLKLSSEERQSILSDIRTKLISNPTSVSEDSAPGILPNIVASRINSVFDLHGHTYVIDAACASGLAAIVCGIQQLKLGEVDAVICGASDYQNEEMGRIYFSGIGALSPDGSFPFDEKAGGFVIGDGAGAVIMKRLDDAISAKNNILAVICGYGHSSDGKGKTVAAPNTAWQARTIERAWRKADIPAETIELIEAHGTSTKVGDLSEVTALKRSFEALGVQKKRYCGIGSVKSNIGHLKSAAGIAGFIKTVLALEQKVLPPSAGFTKENPKLELTDSPFYVIEEAREWTAKEHPRRAGVSAFGFGGTNYHIALEEYREEDYTGAHRKNTVSVPATTSLPSAVEHAVAVPVLPETDLELPGPDVVFFSGETEREIVTEIEACAEDLARAPSEAQTRIVAQNLSADATASLRLGLVVHSVDSIRRQLESISAWIDKPDAPKALSAKGVAFGKGERIQNSQVALLFPGQGSQYPDMLRPLFDRYASAHQTLMRADAMWQKLAGCKVSTLLSSETDGEEQTEARLRDTRNTHPAVVTSSLAIFGLLEEMGLTPKALVGHSVGEFSALTASKRLSFKEALTLIHARATAFSEVSEDSRGAMLALPLNIEDTQTLLKREGVNLAIANVNSSKQTIVSGEKEEAMRLVDLCQEKSIRVIRLNVSHAFHSPLMVPAEQKFRQTLEKTVFQKGLIPVIANGTNTYYGFESEAVRRTLWTQITGPVRFQQSIERLYEDGIRLLVEVGPGSTLSSLTRTILQDKAATVLSSDTRRKKSIDPFLEMLCSLFARGISIDPTRSPKRIEQQTRPPIEVRRTPPKKEHIDVPAAPTGASSSVIVYSGVSVGLPGSYKESFRDDNFDQLFEGRNLIEHSSDKERRRMVDLGISKVVKSAEGASFKSLTALDEVIQLAGKMGVLDMKENYHIEEKDVADMSGAIAAAVAAGYEALRDAQIPLVHEYTQTKSGRFLPDKWSLPGEMQAHTGVIFANGFPMVEPIIEEVSRHLSHRYGNQARDALFETFDTLIENMSDKESRKSLLDWYVSNRERLAPVPNEGEVYRFNHRFMTQIAMQANNRLAKYINARGPNFQINAACSSTCTAITLAESLIHAGKAKRMIVIGGDDPTSEHAFPYLGAGFLATGACTNEANLYEAALPFDRRRQGMIMGAGAVGLVVETDEECANRGVTPICELLGSRCFNAAAHGSQLDVPRYADELDKFMSEMETTHAVSRQALAKRLVYISHETYTPPRGGCAESEATALRHVFGEVYREIEIGNTKGMTGHTMGAAIEDAISAKALQFGKAPPVVNHKVTDPALEGLKLSTGRHGDYDYALRMAAGFGSQGNYILLKRRAKGLHRISDPAVYQSWLTRISGDSDPILNDRGRILTVEDRRPGAIVVNRPDLGSSVSSKKSVLVVPSDKPEPSPPIVKKVHAPPAARGDARALVIEIVAEITGYERDMLDMDMDLEADLGVDTVKQATVLATLAERLELTNLSNLRLSDYPTLGHIAALCQESVYEPGAVENIPTTGESPPETPKSNTSSAGPTSRPDISETVLGVISEISGYTTDVLEADMDLEADLGIDTVKQATIWSTLAEQFNIPPNETVRMSDFATIESLNAFFAAASSHASRAQVSRASADDVPSTPNTQSSTESRDTVIRECCRIVGELTPYPADMLEPDITLESDMALDDETRKRIEKALIDSFALPETWKLPKDPSLAVLGDTVWQTKVAGHTDGAPDQWLGRQVPALRSAPLSVDDRLDIVGKRAWIVGDDAHSVSLLDTAITKAGCSTSQIVFAGENMPAALSVSLERAATEGPPNILIDLTASPVSKNILQEPLSSVLSDIERAMDGRFAMCKWLDAKQWRPERILAVTAVDGRFAISPPQSTNVSALYGLYIGFYKSIRKEWKKSRVTVLDLAPAAWKDGGSSAIRRIEAEISAVGDGVEICYPDEERHRVVATDSSWSEVSRGCTLGNGEVVVATGGGAGITAQIVLALAKQTPASFALIGRTRLDESADELIGADEKTKAEVKERIRRELAAATTRVTPVMIEQAYAKLERSAEISETLSTLEKLGSKALYIQADVCDAASISAAIEKTREELGPITTLIHGAGQERSHLLEQKSEAEFREIHSVKTIGAYHLNRICQTDPLRRIVNMSSISGRFGNAAQCDYAGANAFLDMMARTECRPGIRAVSLLWSGWSEKGMAWRNSFVRQNAEKTGLSFIHPNAAAEKAALEIAAPEGQREVIIHRGLGDIVDRDQTDCPLDAYPLIDWIEKRNDTPIAGYRRFSPERDAFLDQHRLAGTPLMPGVGFMEMMAETAVLLGAPRESAFIYRQLSFTDAFKLHRDEPRDVRLEITPGDDENTHRMTVKGMFTPTLGNTSEVRDYCHATISQCPAPEISPPVVLPPLDKVQVSTWVKTLDAAKDRKHNVLFGPLFNEARRPRATRLSSQIRWNESGIETLVPLPKEQLAHPGYPLEQWVVNPAFLDTLHQAGAILAIELTAHVYLPVGAEEFIVLLSPKQDALYRVTAALTYLDETSARYDMSMVREDGVLCASIRGAEFRRIHD